MHALRHVALVAIGGAVLGLAACEDDVTTTNSTSSNASTTNASTTSTSSTGGNGGVGGGTATDDIAEFCDSVMDAFCEALFACCTDPAELDSFGGTVEACKMQVPECETELNDALGPLYAMGLTDLDPDRLAACVSTLESLATGACTEPPQLALYLCYTAFEGKVPAGESCGLAGNDVSWAECEEGYCAGGTCEAFLESNAPCTPGDGDPGPYCNFTEGEWCLSASNTCGPRLAAGQPCLAGADNPECLSMNCPAGQCELPDAQQLCAEGT